MRKLIFKMNVSMDGFVAGANGEIDWIFRQSSEASKAWVARLLEEAGTHIMGSRTFASMASHWPTSADILAARMNDVPKVVFSRSGTTKAIADVLEKLPDTAAGRSWKAAHVATGDLREEIERLKREPGKAILAQGGATFARSLVASGLIDEYQLVVHPIMLGQGLSPFADLPKPLVLEPVDTTTFAHGVTARVFRAL